ncbi:F-box domain-containing protein [Balamuthia mandrillaris]
MQRECNNRDPFGLPREQLLEALPQLMRIELLILDHLIKHLDGKRRRFGDGGGRGGGLLLTFFPKNSYQRKLVHWVAERYGMSSHSVTMRTFRIRQECFCCYVEIPARKVQVRITSDAFTIPTESCHTRYYALLKKRHPLWYCYALLLLNASSASLLPLADCQQLLPEFLSPEQMQSKLLRQLHPLATMNLWEKRSPSSASSSFCLKLSESHEESLMDSLPTEVVLHIFSFLDVADCVCASMTCKRWWRIVHLHDGLLWHPLAQRLQARLDRWLTPSKEREANGKAKRIDDSKNEIREEEGEGRDDEQEQQHRWHDWVAAHYWLQVALPRSRTCCKLVKLCQSFPRHSHHQCSESPSASSPASAASLCECRSCKQKLHFLPLLFPSSKK